MRDQADKYTSEGKLVEAGEVRKQIDKTLKDLSAAQAKMIGQGTQAEGRAARDEWEKLNAQIIENMTKEQELYKQRKAKNDEIAAEQESAVNFIKDRLEEISAIKPFDQSAMGQLDGWLQQLNVIKGRMEEIVALSAAINGPNSGASSKPSGKAGLVGGGVGFAVGTDYVPETGLALIHKGEMIIPAEEAAGIRAARNSAAAGNGGGYGSSAPGMGLSGGSAAGIGGGGGGWGGSSPNSLTINNNMTAHMAQASPNAVFAAMAAAAQISGIRRR